MESSYSHKINYISANIIYLKGTNWEWHSISSKCWAKDQCQTHPLYPALYPKHWFMTINQIIIILDSEFASTGP